MVDLSKVLQTYTLLEVLELNDITELEVLEILVRDQFITKLEPVPVDATYD